MIWGIFIALTALHIFANVRAMRCLQLRSLNRPRLALLLRTYMATQASMCSETLSAHSFILIWPQCLSKSCASDVHLPVSLPLHLAVASVKP